MSHCWYTLWLTYVVSPLIDSHCLSTFYACWAPNSLRAPGKFPWITCTSLKWVKICIISDSVKSIQYDLLDKSLPMSRKCFSRMNQLWVAVSWLTCDTFMSPLTMSLQPLIICDSPKCVSVAFPHESSWLAGVLHVWVTGDSHEFQVVNLNLSITHLMNNQSFAYTSR